MNDEKNEEPDGLKRFDSFVDSFDNDRGNLVGSPGDLCGNVMFPSSRTRSEDWRQASNDPRYRW